LKISSFREKSKTAPIEKVAAEGQFEAYMHKGFWKCMDTQRDKQQLEELIIAGNAPWMVWKE